MTHTDSIPWHEANQRYLTASLQRVRRLLEQAGGPGRPVADPGDEEAPGAEPLAAGRGAEAIPRAEPLAADQEAAKPPGAEHPAAGLRAEGAPRGAPLAADQEAERALRESEADLPGPAALDALGAAFGLSPFERDVLLLCAGVELDASFASLVASLQDSGKAPTFGMALASLPDAHWSALTPDSPLRRWRLIDVGGGDGLTAAPLRVDERVLHFLTGVHCTDEQLAGFVQPVGAEPLSLAPSQAAVAEDIAGAWMLRSKPAPVIQLVGSTSAGKLAVAAAAASRIGLTLQLMQAPVIPSGPHERDVLMRLWEREAMLSGSVLLIDAEDLPQGDVEGTAPLKHVLESTQALLLVAARTRLRLPNRPTYSIEVRKPTTSEQYAVWDALLSESGEALNGQLERLAGHFDLSVSAIEAACRQALGDTRPEAPASSIPDASTHLSDEDHADGDGGLAERLWAACRTYAKPELSDLAQPIRPAASWKDLVLPERQMQMLHELAIHVRRRMTVYEKWGFAAKSSRGLGISALFAGPSGTGKTMAAEVLANRLELDLYRIDLSRVVNKYIGETEKNLARVFDAAEEGGAILLFDEADALFGKRSEVKDSHDRYANIEVSYLLQRMEAYRGLAILTSNLKNALDEAFLRRLRFVVTFPFPDASQRAAIWRHIFPAQTPTEGLDPEKLASLNVTGGSIRNIALNAAFLAAEDGTPLRTKHVLRAARTEYGKLERPLTDAEIRGWT